MPVLLYLLALAVFALGTSEFVLAGLIPGIAADLDISTALAGLLTSGFALGMVIGAPLMAIAARRLAPRWTLSGFLVLFIAAHVVGALTGSYGVLLATRVVGALANAGFLAVALSTVVRVVPPERRTRALAIILAGTTVALVAGVPAGSFVGELLDWRATLWAIAALCVPALFCILVATPTSSVDDDGGVPRTRVAVELAVPFARPVRTYAVLAVITNAATFGSFTYLAVIASEASGISGASVPGLLAVFGVGAFAGVTVSGRYGDDHWRRMIHTTGPLLALTWGATALLVEVAAAMWVLVFVQGSLSFVLGSTLIARIVTASVAAPTLGGSFATVALNIGAVAGPVLGGLAIEELGSRGPLIVSAGLVAMAATTAMLTRETTAGPRAPTPGGGREADHH